MSQPEVLQATENGVAWITLNRPDSLNALNAALLKALRAALEQAAADDAVRAVVITGAGRGFSSGADLQATGSGGPRDPGRTLREFYHPLIELMRAMPKPIVTAVNGVAAGAGMSIALAGDIVVAGQSATFLQAFSKIGLVPDAGSTWFLPRYAGDVRARALAMLADRISSADALQYGMVWKVYADDALLAEARKMAEYLAKMPTRAYALIKQALNGTYDRTLTDQLELEAQLQTEAVKTEDAAEGVRAFVEKRPPNFKGR
jgi:2-(1,2-epoxy-1,2-dihydrophenyl)acetyl-CoA isomerase